MAFLPSRRGAPLCDQRKSPLGMRPKLPATKKKQMFEHLYHPALVNCGTMSSRGTRLRGVGTAFLPSAVPKIAAFAPLHSHPITFATGKGNSHHRSHFHRNKRGKHLQQQSSVLQTEPSKHTFADSRFSYTIRAAAATSALPTCHDFCNRAFDGIAKVSGYDLFQDGWFIRIGI